MEPARTQFQVSCEGQLVALLSTLGHILESRSRGSDPLGDPEPFVRAAISRTPFEVYIYADEAHLYGPKLDRRFEVGAFHDGQSLISAFLATVSKSLARLG
jgi:hypothetical protein